MNIKISVPRITAMAIVVFSFSACDHDFKDLGSNIIGEPGFNASLYEDAEISTNMQKLPIVQTNNLPVYSLGVYPSETFGTETTSIYTQISLTTPAPIFGKEAQLDSVVLSLPYYSTEVKPKENGDKEYKLDSIFGKSPIKLSVLPSNYFLSKYDPEINFEQAQKYYSDLESKIESQSIGEVLFTAEKFRPSASEIHEYHYGPTGEVDTVTTKPAMRLKLSKEFFQQKIINKEGSQELATHENFHNYLRGLYIKAEAVDDKGSMMLFNFSDDNAKITLYFTYKVTNKDDDDEESKDAHGSYQLEFGPAKVNTFKQNLPTFSDNKNLYLKGGAGTMAVIDLFSGPDSDGDGVSDELDELRENNWLVNEANLTFYVNQQDRDDTREPEHVYLYDLDNNKMLADYVLDSPNQYNKTTSTSNLSHLNPLKLDDDDNGLYYKIKLTRHITNVLNNDSTNVKLGLVVTENLNVINNSAVKGNPDINKVPAGSVISPAGTILYGPNAENEDKRLKLRIYYSEPKE